MLIKVYGNDPEGQKRYSPAQCLGTQKHEIMGDPDPKHISTSYVERQNLNMRMQMMRIPSDGDHRSEVMAIAIPN